MPILYNLTMDKMGDIIIRNDAEPNKDVFLQFQSDKEPVMDILKPKEKRDIEHGWPIYISSVEPRSHTLEELWEVGAKENRGNKWNSMSLVERTRVLMEVSVATGQEFPLPLVNYRWEELPEQLRKDIKWNYLDTVRMRIKREKGAGMVKENPGSKVTTLKRLYLQLGDKRYEVVSLEDASVKYRIAIQGLMSDEIPKAYINPRIYDDSGKYIGYISHNGKVWEGEPKNWKENKLLYNPY